jgi:hypothetical protein
MLIPLFLPDAGRGMSGELVGLFNKRPFRLVIVNITDKVVSQSQVNRSRILRKLDDEQTADHRVDMKGWHLYMFWGYRSPHANLPCQFCTSADYMGRAERSRLRFALNALCHLPAKAGYLTSTGHQLEAPQPNASAAEHNSSPCGQSPRYTLLKAFVMTPSRNDSLDREQH